MRGYLVGITLLLAAVVGYQGLVLRGLVPGASDPWEAEATGLVLAAAGAMLLGAITMRRLAGIAAVELALGGIALLVVADADHRYLLAYGATSLGLAGLAAIVEMEPASHGRRRTVRRSPQVQAREVRPPSPNRPRREPGATVRGRQSASQPCPTSVGVATPSRQVTARIAQIHERRSRQARRTRRRGPERAQEAAS